MRIREIQNNSVILDFYRPFTKMFLVNKQKQMAGLVLLNSLFPVVDDDDDGLKRGTVARGGT